MEQKIKINCVIGIDPGRMGGIAIFVPGKLVKVVKMPKDVGELNELLTYYAENYNPIVFLEKLNVRPDDASVEGAGVNMGKLYRIQKLIANFEHLKAVIEVCGVPYVLVHPLSWQTKLKLRKLGSREDKAQRKKRYQRAAASFYPEVRATLWNADALLIMHFGRYALVNEPSWIKANLPEREYEKLF